LKGTIIYSLKCVDTTAKVYTRTGTRTTRELSFRFNMAVTKAKCLQIVKANLLVLLTLIGAAIGFMIGIAVRNTHPTESTLMWIGKLTYFYCIIIK